MRAARPWAPAKYGKEYAQCCTDNSTAGACGANPVVMSKLSVKPPDPEEKLAKMQGASLHLFYFCHASRECHHYY